MLYLYLNDEVPHDSHPVTPCAGDRVEGDACLPQCLGHYEWGTEGENGVLEAIPLFRGATKVSGWSDPDDPCRTSDIVVSVRLYRDDASFKDARGATLTVFALMITGDYSGDSIFLLTEPKVADAEYRRAVASLDDGCHCIDFA